ncbi:hypothetical protein BpHYR1_010820 [Brachionus plicatilis]|uniref:Uncharacterized protein n=1 Tax=Brachionus plicatilis TaxID=10195 RepID=A0A3M7QH95_BRAPC|nr:hypothetical protein BpHYR1_010820 [Brachionus plicatilis]
MSKITIINLSFYLGISVVIVLLFKTSDSYFYDCLNFRTAKRSCGRHNKYLERQKDHVAAIIIAWNGKKIMWPP